MWIKSSPLRPLLCLSIILLLCACQSQSKARAVPADAKPGYQSKSQNCPKQVPTAYTGPLIIESKYDQTDPTKSRLKSGVSKQSRAIQEQVAGYTKRLVNFADYYDDADDEKRRQQALTCLHEWLETWAAADALLSEESTKTGKAVRKWALAAISSVIIRMHNSHPGVYKATPTQKEWLSKLAEQVVKDYAGRLDPAFPTFNNHDYWAAWAVASTGAIVDRSSFMDWGRRNLVRGISQIQLDKQTNLGYLPNEIARQQLAANYTHYALVPLILLADLYDLYEQPLNKDQKARLKALALFALTIVSQPEKVSSITEIKQQKVPTHKMSWIIPYLQNYPDDTLARALYSRYGEKLGRYSQVGGKISALHSSAIMAP